MRFGEANATAIRLGLGNDGLVTYPGLRSAGLSKANIARLTSDQAITKVVHAIYQVGLPGLSQRQLWRCGEMLGGPASVLTARSVFEIRGAVTPRTGIATIVTTRRDVARHVKTLVPMSDGGSGMIRVVPCTKAAPCEQVERLRCAPVPRALVDLAAGPDKRQLRRIWDKAEFRGLLDLAAIEEELGAARRKGGAAVRALVDARQILTGADTKLRSPKELDVLHLIASAGLPLPEENVAIEVEGHIFIVDYLWRELRLILELDSPDHLKPEAGAADRTRDQLLFVAGYDPQRYLDSDALADPAKFVAWLGQAIERQRRRVA